VTPTQMQATEFVGQDLLDTDGDKIGKIQDVYLDEKTQRPEWFAVRTGLFGMRHSFVPVSGVWRDANGVCVPYSKSQVKDAPNVEPDGRLSQDEEADLYDHYGLPYSDAQSDTGLPAGQAGGWKTGERDTTDTGKGRDAAMTRSEEELVAGKRQTEAGKARLVKYVETEHRTVTIPVQRERARLVTEPVTEANRDKATTGPDIRENVHEETLYEEEPVVEKRTVPKERVRLEKESKTDEREVAADLRKEKVRTEGEVDDKTKR
jgi:uncharacterized protein (TIGR02271 family)